MATSRKGIFVVLEGNDGAGKATQTELLLQKLRVEGRRAEKIDFPKYGGNVFGALIGECLAGKHGDFLNLDPKIASSLYALDRFESSARVRALLEDGVTVIADRYAGSNQIHQGGKIENDTERKLFLLWLENIEFGILNIPRPDLTVYLRVPLETSLRLLQEKRAAKNQSLEERERDVVEEDHSYLERSIKTADWLMGREGWRVVECMENNVLRTREAIHEEVWNNVYEKLTTDT